MRILFVAIQSSIHTLRWIDQIIDQGWDIHIAPSGVGDLRQEFYTMPVTYHGPKTIPQMRINNLVSRVLSRWRIPVGQKFIQQKKAELTVPVSAQHLESIVNRIQPDIIHSMVTQRSGYRVLELQEKIGSRMPIWINSCWGSDLYFYHRVPEHKQKIERLLTACDYFYTECERDVTLARELGFKGTIFSSLAAAAGMRLDEVEALRSPLPPSQRKYILLKGYQTWAGRALTGLQAIELCAETIRERGYTILVQLAEPDLELVAEAVSNDIGVPIEFLPRASHTESVRRIGMARVHLALSISDGLPMSTVEAMATGTFPIQSDTSCLNSIIQNGVTGLLVPHWDPYAIADALQKALTDDEMVDRASEINQQYVRDNWEFEAHKQKVIDHYKHIYEHGQQRKRTQPA